MPWLSPTFLGQVNRLFIVIGALLYTSFIDNMFSRSVIMPKSKSDYRASYAYMYVNPSAYHIQMVSRFFRWSYS